MLMAGLFVITSEDGYSQKMVSDDGWWTIGYVLKTSKENIE